MPVRGRLLAVGNFSAPAFGLCASLERYARANQRKSKAILRDVAVVRALMEQPDEHGYVPSTLLAGPLRSVCDAHDTYLRADTSLDAPTGRRDGGTRGDWLARTQGLRTILETAADAGTPPEPDPVTRESIRGVVSTALAAVMTRATHEIGISLERQAQAVVACCRKDGKLLAEVRRLLASLDEHEPRSLGPNESLRRVSKRVQAAGWMVRAPNNGGWLRTSEGTTALRDRGEGETSEP